MSRIAAMLPALLVLTACGDPLDSVKRLTRLMSRVRCPWSRRWQPRRRQTRTPASFGASCASGRSHPGQRWRRERPKTAARPRLEQAAAEPEPGADDAGRHRRGGLFGGRKAASAGVSALREAQPGEVLRFGQVARACHVGRGELGKVVAKYPERGARYRVHDNRAGPIGAAHILCLRLFRWLPAPGDRRRWRCSARRACTRRCAMACR